MDFYISPFVIRRNSIKDIDIKNWASENPQKKRPESNFRPIRPKIRREKIAWKTLREESYLDEQVDRLTNAEWLAPPGLSASTTQTFYPRHSWNVSSSLLVICNSRFFSFFAILLRLLRPFRRCLRFPELLTRLLETLPCPVHRAMYDGIPSIIRGVCYCRFFEINLSDVSCKIKNWEIENFVFGDLKTR